MRASQSLCNIRGKMLSAPRSPVGEGGRGEGGGEHREICDVQGRGKGS